MANIDLCKRIQCGALSQVEAGPAALIDCAQAGLVGALGCGHPDCLPYTDDMRLRGVCPPLPDMIPVTPIGGGFLAPAVATTAPSIHPALPSITPIRPEAPLVEATVPDPWYCPVNRWVSGHRLLAVGVVAGVYLLLAGGRKAQ